MTIDPELRDIGHELVEYSKDDADFTAQRGVVDDLFPYIYQASRRMSTRAISRWLEEVHKVKLSAVTIAKALREAEKYWELFWERIEPAARIVEDCTGVAMKEFLVNGDLAFTIMDRKQAVVSGESGLMDFENACETLRTEWFALDESVREQCWNFLPEEEETKDKSETAKEGKENE